MEAIKFGRFLLLNAVEAWDNGVLCWNYQEKLLNTEELYEIFINL